MPQIEQRFGMASTGEPVMHFTIDFSGIRTDSVIIFICLVGNLQMVTAHVVCHEHALLCTDASNQTFTRPMCLSQLHSPAFLSEVTNVVATHRGCSHVADEPKELIPCLKTYKWHPKSFTATTAI